MKVLKTDAVIIGNTLCAQMAAYTLLKQKKCQVWLIGTGFPDMSYMNDLVRFPAEGNGQAYYQSLRRTGCGQNDPKLARALCDGSAKVMNELRELGVSFEPVDEMTARAQWPAVTHALESALPEERFPRLPVPVPVTPQSVKELDQTFQDWMDELKGGPQSCLHTFLNWAAKRIIVRDGRVRGVLCADRWKEELQLVSCGTVLLTEAVDAMSPALAMGYYAGAALGDLEFAARDEETRLRTGGLIVSPDGQTNVPGLLAAGKSACGIHGAGIKAGDINTAELVFGKRAGDTLAASAMPSGGTDAQLLAWAEENVPSDDTASGSAWIMDPASPYRELLSQAISVSDLLSPPLWQEKLEAALQKVSHLQHEFNELPPASTAETIARLSLEDRLIFLRLTVFAALERRDSVGCFRRKDYPNRAKKPYRVRMGLTGMLLFPEKENWKKHPRREEP